ncbi:MAG: YggS family pyridoxal phosphate-dependent enzyme, partial [Spirochaetales bacterium]|nr:YggS family pyridoxal phosphate-dependent enzyme [Spirochaetales bacterium]
AEIHLVGHLQRNKARDAAVLYHAVDSIDAERTVTALDARLAEADRRISVLVEVNTSREEQKHGVRPFEELERVAASIADTSHLELRGLMTIGPISRDELVLRRAFAMLRDYRDRLASQMPDSELPELSMGMSNDLEEAILEGATTIRVGTALFGERTT